MNLAHSPESNVYWKRVSIPKGLPALLETLAKEAIRENPEDIVGFLSKLIDELIAKRDQEEEGKGSEVGGGGGDSRTGSAEGSKGKKILSDEENPLLENKEGLSKKYTQSDEEIAASKIQAGFRGFQTRKSLKSGHNKKGGELSLTSLTPLLNSNDKEDGSEGGEDEDVKRKQEKAEDEAIAAEIKTPLGTIREESLEGSQRIRTPEALPILNQDDIKEEVIPTSAEADALHETGNSESLISEELTEITEETENTESIKKSDEDNLETEEVVKVDENESESDIAKVSEESEKIEKSIEETVITADVTKALESQGFSLENDEIETNGESNASDSNATGEEGISMEIAEPEVETLIEPGEVPVVEPLTNSVALVAESIADDEIIDASATADINDSKNDPESLDQPESSADVDSEVTGEENKEKLDESALEAQASEQTDSLKDVDGNKSEEEKDLSLSPENLETEDLPEELVVSNESDIQNAVQEDVGNEGIKDDLEEVKDLSETDNLNIPENLETAETLDGDQESSSQDKSELEVANVQAEVDFDGDAVVIEASKSPELVEQPDDNKDAETSEALENGDESSEKPDIEKTETSEVVENEGVESSEKPEETDSVETTQDIDKDNDESIDKSEQEDNTVPLKQENENGEAPDNTENEKADVSENLETDALVEKSVEEQSSLIETAESESAPPVENTDDKEAPESVIKSDSIPEPEDVSVAEASEPIEKSDDVLNEKSEDNVIEVVEKTEDEIIESVEKSIDEISQSNEKSEGDIVESVEISEDKTTESLVESETSTPQPSEKVEAETEIVPIDEKDTSESIENPQDEPIAPVELAENEPTESVLITEEGSSESLKETEEPLKNLETEPGKSSENENINVDNVVENEDSVPNDGETPADILSEVPEEAKSETPVPEVPSALADESPNDANNTPPPPSPHSEPGDTDDASKMSPQDEKRPLSVKSNSLLDNVDGIEFIDEDIVETTSGQQESDLPTPAETPDNSSNRNISNESLETPEPLFPDSEKSSFANADSSVSSSTTTTTTTVRPTEDEKHESSSQEALSLTETPVPKPRKPASASSERATSPVVVVRRRQHPDEADKENAEIAEESKEVVSELTSVEPEQPVVTRRPKSSPKNRGRAVSSKYRSGIVVDDEVSMEEMEAQIENEMMTQAATKIQAGFRGYKTRKSFRESGVSSARNEGGDKDKNTSDEKSPAVTAIASTDTASKSPKGDELLENACCAAYSQAEQCTSKDDRNPKPSLAFLRSRSFPGSVDVDDDGIPIQLDIPCELIQPELEYDPGYVNHAATKIQATVRGYLVRKEFKNNKLVGWNVRTNPDDSDQAFEDIDINDPVQYSAELIINPAERDSVSPMSEAGSEQAAAKIQAAFRGYKDRQKVRQTKKAVVTIQATVRGFLTRRRLAKIRRRSMQRRRSSAKSMVSHEIQRVQSANDAATKIQAVYRGYQVRSKNKKSNEDK